MQLTMNLASRIQISTVEMGMWRATKLNKTESERVNRDNGSGNAAKVIVRLTDNFSLISLQKLHAEAYQEHRKITLPSIQDGMRIVPSGKQPVHAAVMADFRRRHNSLVTDFLADYETIKSEAPVKLNGLFDGKKWPSKEVVAGKFSFAYRYLPCPSDGAWGDWLNESAQAGQGELRERLVNSARHLATVLKGDGKLYQSALDNLREVCELAGEGFNLLDDPIIEQAARELRPHATQAAASLRDAENIRRDTGDKIASILGVLNL